MADFLEILVCVLAVFGGYTLLDMLRERLLYPRRVRARLRGAVILDDDDSICAVVQYASHLRREQKISSERLIILVKDDIIEDSEYLAQLGEIFAVREANINNGKEREL